MCTLILAHRIIENTPILFGATRDEQLSRPAEGPALRVNGGLGVHADAPPCLSGYEYQSDLLNALLQEKTA